jgi:hypothetical protein
MALQAGLAPWAVRASVWFGLALPVTIRALDRESSPRPDAADRGVPVASGLVLAALAAALAVVFPPVRRAMASDGPPRPELTSAPRWPPSAGWRPTRSPARCSTSLAASGRWRLAFSHADERMYVRTPPRAAATRLPGR